MADISGLSKKEIQEEYEDLVFRKVMAIYVQKEGKQILSEIEEEKKNDDTVVDSKVIVKLYDKKERKENLNILWKYSKKLVQFAAMVVFVAIISLSSVVIAFADVREAVVDAIYHLVYEENEKYTKVVIGESKGFVDEEIYSWENAYAPTYIPQGFSFGEMQDLDSQKIITYFSETNFISFAQAQNVVTQADTENADRVDHIKINDSEGLLVVKGELTSIIWNIGDTLFTVLGNYSTEELINIANSIKLVK